MEEEEKEEEEDRTWSSIKLVSEEGSVG